MPSAEKQQYQRDSKRLKGPGPKALATKVRFGGSLSSFSMYKLGSRDLEMNRDLYIEAKKEREAIKAKKYERCNLCGGPKFPGFKICRKCHLLKGANAIKE